MLNLIKKENLTKEELEQLDHYWDNNCESSVILLDVEDICNLIKRSKEILGYSLYEISLQYYLACDALILYEYATSDENIDLSLGLKYYEILKFLDKESDYDTYFEMGRILGRYYYFSGDNENATKYYREAFTEGFRLDSCDYIEDLKNYMNLIGSEDKKTELLESLVKNVDYSAEYGLDAIDTHLYLLINLAKDDERYLKYIDQALEIAYTVVRRYQNSRKHTCWSDTDEERDLCELLTLKFEYYVLKGEYVSAFEMYKELTVEIGRSDCTRYYHAREKYYYQMLKDMSATYKELEFFDDIGYALFEIKEEIGDIGDYMGKEITLIDSLKREFKFKIVNIYENDEVHIVPLLPIIGEGAKIFTNIIKENGNYYLKNMLSR